MSFVYEDDLKSTLTKFGEVLEKLDKLNMQKDEIRIAIKNFIKINKIEEIDILDTVNQLWRIGISMRSRKSVDYELLEEYLNDVDYESVVTIKESEFLTSKKVKKRKTKKDKPKAPSVRATIKNDVNNYLKEQNV